MKQITREDVVNKWSEEIAEYIDKYGIENVYNGYMYAETLADDLFPNFVRNVNMGFHMISTYKNAYREQQKIKVDLKAKEFIKQMIFHFTAIEELEELYTAIDGLTAEQRGEKDGLTGNIPFYHIMHIYYDIYDVVPLFYFKDNEENQKAYLIMKDITDMINEFSVPPGQPKPGEPGHPTHPGEG